MEIRFFSQKGSGGGRGVKEKKQGDGDAHSLGNGGALSGMGAAEISNTVNDVGKDSDGLNLSPTKVTLRNSVVNKEGNLHDENDGLTPSKSAANPNKCTSYANIFTDGPSRKAMNFCTLFTLAGNRVDVAVPVEFIKVISERFANTVYGFFLGKYVAYLVVANYVRKTWSKYGMVKSMLNSSTGIFSFQFSFVDGLDTMLENSPWFIRNNLLILKKWNSDVSLLKEDVGNVLVWVKLYGIPVTEFSEDGLSAIASKIGTPLMLDSYTSNICIQSWG
ncbi:putative reverse transcriptase domain-containing protein [Tanacetum coccineum]